MPWWTLTTLLFAAAMPSFAQEKLEPPRVALASPLAIPAGQTTKVTLRGWKLDETTEVKPSSAEASIKILSKGKADVPNRQDAKQIGDTQVEIELAAPVGMAAGEISLMLATSHGETAPYALLIGGEHPLAAEKETNQGFRQAQQITIPQIIDGQIQAERDVDVYSFEAAQDQRLLVEVIARRRGSGLDGVLTLYDERGNIMASQDDAADSPDPRLEVSIPAAGRYFLSMLDAHDCGGPAHPYRLVVR
jgi:hypothetical protein